MCLWCESWTWDRQGHVDTDSAMCLHVDTDSAMCLSRETVRYVFASRQLSTETLQYVDTCTCLCLYLWRETTCERESTPHVDACLCLFTLLHHLVGPSFVWCSAVFFLVLWFLCSNFFQLIFFFNFLLNLFFQFFFLKFFSANHLFNMQCCLMASLSYHDISRTPF